MDHVCPDEVKCAARLLAFHSLAAFVELLLFSHLILRMQLAVARLHCMQPYVTATIQSF